jgi:hypothetical protein
VTPGVEPIAKSHHHLLDVTRTFTLTRRSRKEADNRPTRDQEVRLPVHTERLKAVRATMAPDIGRKKQRSWMGSRLNSHHRDTLAQVFRHPTSHNIEWHDILSLLNAVGTVRDTHKGHIEVTIDNVTEVLEPARHKEIETEQLAILRRLLRRSGYAPEDLTG